MKKLATFLLIVTAALAAFSQTPNSSDGKSTPAERSILQAKWLIAKNPKDFKPITPWRWRSRAVLARLRT